jgi:hypothetical protein
MSAARGPCRRACVHAKPPDHAPAKTAHGQVSTVLPGYEYVESEKLRTSISLPDRVVQKGKIYRLRAVASQAVRGRPGLVQPWGRLQLQGWCAEPRSQGFSTSYGEEGFKNGGAWRDLHASRLHHHTPATPNTNRNRNAETAVCKSISKPYQKVAQKRTCNSFELI